MRFLLFFLIPVLLVKPVFSQARLPVIKATSKKVAIKDGGYLDKNAWSLSPGIRPDVFTADRTRKTKWVTFYTDIDSIRVKVKPGSHFDFVVVLNGKDSCFTRIASAIPPDNATQTTRSDTIPFTLTAHNAIAVKAVIDDVDTLNLHFDLSSFDVHLTRDGIVNTTHLLADKAKPNFNKLDKVSKLQMGSATWTSPDVMSTIFTAIDMDGRFGWNLFEGKTVEVDYDRQLIIVQSGLPGGMKGYTKAKVAFERSFPYLKGTFNIAGKQYTGNFMMDTGSELALILDSAWVRTQGFPTDLKLIKSSFLQDPRGTKYETRTVLAPAFQLNGFTLSDIPTMLLSARNPTGFSINFLGNGLLKHFNMILDFKHDYIYLKPNQLMGASYKVS